MKLQPNYRYSYKNTNNALETEQLGWWQKIDGMVTYGAISMD